jgi:1,4-alpha-glucan branching enzyme
MLKKSYSKTGKSCRVTFKLDRANLAADTAENAITADNAKEVALLGEFNSWSPAANPMKRRKDGSFSTTISLDAGQDYRFRYLMDGDTWNNEEAADNLVPNPFGGRDSLITV